MSSKIVLIARLWIRDNDVVSFEAYERKACAILKQHGGHIERAIRISAAGGQADAPFEMHLVCFPCREDLEAYRSDPELRSLAAGRSRIITRTEVVEGYDATEYLRHAAI